jgi:hypothetical protein
MLSVWALLLFFHLAISGFSPMPWFDETYFASMALHFSETGEFSPPVCPLMDYYYPQSKAYGPAYFVLLAGVFKTIGFGMFQMRLPSILFGFGFILVAYRMLRDGGVPSALGNFVFLLLIFDPIFLQNIHSGRMDSMALFMSAAGSFFLLRGIRNQTWKDYLFCGIFLAFAILSTPRVAVNMFGAGMVAFLAYLFAPGWKAWFRILLIPAIIAGLYSVWVFWGFGGYSEAWNYFFGQPKEKLYYDSLAQGYISFKKYIPPFQFPALIVFGVFLIVVFVRRRPLSWLFWICLLNVAAYFALVKDTGLYSIFSIPWVYMLLAILVSSISGLEPVTGRIRMAFIMLILMNTGIFLTKQTVVLLSAPSRNAELAQKAFSACIPAGSRVIGDDAYYYVSIHNGCDFQYLDRGAAGFQRVKYHDEKFRFQYLVVRNPVSNPKEFEHYRKKFPLRKIGEIPSPEPSLVLRRFESFLKVVGIKNIPLGYRGTIYAR